MAPAPPLHTIRFFDQLGRPTETQDALWRERDEAGAVPELERGSAVDRRKLERNAGA